MSEWTKTGMYLGLAAFVSLAAVGSHYWSRPSIAPVDDLVGEPLFDSFEADQVRELEIVAYDSLKQDIRRFRVQNRDGTWRIPSHHQYPAEAAQRLFETAMALYGLDRLALAGRWTDDQKRFGVVAPDTETAETADAEEIGQRVILRDAGGEILADLIVGKPIDLQDDPSRQDAFANPEDRQQRFYVRRGDENATYVANLNIRLSTRFSDWIEPDLLQLDQTEIVKLIIDNYELQIRDELTQRGVVRRIGKLDKDRHVLSREKPFDPWSLEGLDEAKEELHSSNLNKILGLLDAMVIAGVRPKVQIDGQPILNGDLTINTELEVAKSDPGRFQEAILELQSELMKYGFNIVPGEKPGEKATFYSNRGEFYVALNDGVTYRLYFGDTVQGDEEAIEIGSSAVDAQDQSPTESSEPPPENPDSEQEQNADETAPGEDPPAPTKKNRYLMVSVAFDPAALGPPPTEPQAPIEPTKPEGYVPAETPPEPSPPADQDAPPEPPVDTRDPVFVLYDEQMSMFKLAQQEYEIERDEYQRELEDYNKRQEQGQAKSKRLADRFGPWFYVISANDLDLLQIPRGELVSVRESDDGTSPDDPSAEMELPPRPDLSF